MIDQSNPDKAHYLMGKTGLGLDPTLTIDKVILDQITDKTLNGHLETIVKVGIELKITMTI